MAPRIPNIPPELVAQIIQHAYGSDIVASCLLVNREWHHFALQVLYKDLVLANIDQLERFLAAHNDSLVRSFTRSLTIYVREDGHPSVILQVRVDYVLCRLAEEVIPHMSSLVSFSLTTDRRTFKWHILRTTISALLIALPLSCVNLELDTDGKDEASFWPMPTYENRRRVEGVGHR
ncbi:hypothetical protein CEP53_001776 [Fusarium sp. AF-6]|nr:hypothetical protein CEP53_001776 [Fusarium sp. AF-6]